MNAIKDEIRDSIEHELTAANEKFPLFASLHEAYGVMLEEFQEAEEQIEECRRFLDAAWRFVRADDKRHAMEHITRLKYAAENMAIEACQLSAMAEKAIQSEAEKVI